jgi:hypothetical protein
MTRHELAIRLLSKAEQDEVVADRLIEDTSITISLTMPTRPAFVAWRCGSSYAACEHGLKSKSARLIDHSLTAIRGVLRKMLCSLHVRRPTALGHGGIDGRPAWPAPME